MGLSSIFSNRATFDGIVDPISSSTFEVEGHEPIRVTSIVQDAYIDVNEKGTIASVKTMGKHVVY